MDQDTGITRETSQEEDRFWIDTERQFFINPNPSLILCLRNHVWHCRYISERSRELLREHENASTDKSTKQKGPKVAKVTNGGASPSVRTGEKPAKTEDKTTSNGRPLMENGIISVKFRIKNKHGNHRHAPYPHMDVQGSAMPINGVTDLVVYPEDSGFTPERTHQLTEYDDEMYFNPIVNGRHDGKLKLPIILPSQAPDGMRIVLYCPDDRSRHGDLATGRRPGFKTSMLNDMLSPDQVPEIIYGPAPIWSRVSRPRFKDGKELGVPFQSAFKSLSEVRGTVVDPVWASHNDYFCTESNQKGSLMRQLALTDISPPCSVDYSPKLFKFVETKGSPLCRRCLGMAKVACPLCMNMEITNHIPGVGFGHPVTIDHKYELVFNEVDIHKARTMMGTEVFSRAITEDEVEVTPMKRSHDDITALLKEYVETLEEIESRFTTILDRVENEKKPNFDAWSEIETKMIKNYIEQYNNKMMDNRYTYNTQRQSCDVLRIRLTCSSSASLPSQWTDHALCSICGSDEDWDDDPILFCDCCYIPMHYCCLGYKAGTMSETMKHNVRRHTLLRTPEGEEPNIDDDEWMCPCCLFLLDQLGFLEESMALRAIRVAAGPRNKQVIDLYRSNATPEDDIQSLDISRLPYVVGFEYDDPHERIDLCTVYRRSSPVGVLVASNQATTPTSATATNATTNGTTPVTPTYREHKLMGKLNFRTLIENGNIPTTIAFNIPDEDIEVPFCYDHRGLETDVLGRTISQFWSFKCMTKAQLEVAGSILDEMLVRHMKDGNLDGMVKLLKHAPPEEDRLHYIIKQDRAIQMSKPAQARRGRKPNELKAAQAQAAAAGIKPEVVETRNTNQLSRDDIYTMNSKNPLKRLVISVRIAKNFFVNLKIPVCIFCGFDAYYPGGGPMKRTSNTGTWGHVRCALAMECVVTPKEIDYDSFVPKIKALRCMVCHNSSTAILQCSHGNCFKAFHVSCASASSICLFTWDSSGRPDVLCPQHASGLAPTVLLRKLQAKVQYKNYKKLSAYESSLDGVNPKDDVYLNHFLEPNYRSIASVIERVFGMNPRSGFSLPLYGDEVTIKQPLNEKDGSERSNGTGERGRPSLSGDALSNADPKSKALKKADFKLPLRDKSGKFKVADKNKAVSRVSGVKASIGKHNAESTAVTSDGERAHGMEQDDGSNDMSDHNERANTSTTPEESADDSATERKDEEVIPYDKSVCRITQLPKEECFWCSVGNEDIDEHSHYKSFYDDRCPSVEQVGNLIFPDLATVKKKCAEICDNRVSDSPNPFEGVPPLVWSEMCSSTRIVDEKMLYFISDDFIGGQRLISEVVSKSCRHSLLGLTRLLNILYFKSNNGNDMPVLFDRLLNFMKIIQSVDEARRSCEIGTNSIGDMFSTLNPMAGDFPGPHAASSAVDNRKECRLRVNSVLRTLNQSVLMSVDSPLLPNAILRVFGSGRNNDNTEDDNYTRRFAVCAGCLEFKTFDQYVDNTEKSEKRVFYVYNYKTCRVCNVKACNECISQMKNSRSKNRVERMPPVQPSADAYMSAASMLAHPMYHGGSPMLMPRPAPPMDESRIPSVRDAVIAMPMMPRPQLLDRMGCHPPRGMAVNAPMNVDPRISSLMVASIHRGAMNQACQEPGVMGRPRMVNSLPLINHNIGDMNVMPLHKSGPMPMCGMIPMGIPGGGPCGPIFNVPAAKTIPGINDRDISTPVSGGPFAKAGIMIKSPPVKNGPFGANMGGFQGNEQLHKPGVVLDGDNNIGTGVITKQEAADGDDSSYESFICCRCEDMENDINLPLLCCALCSRFDGFMIPVNKDHLSFHPNWTSEYCGYCYVHMVCLDWLTYSTAVNANMRKFLKTLFEYPCNYCGVACGATMLCANNYCNVRFHASCGAWLGCKVDTGKKMEGTSSASRRVYCLRHTLLSVTRMSQAERKFLLAPSNLYELLIATKYHITGFYSGVYLSRYCVPNKMKTDPNTRPAVSRLPNNAIAKRPKPSSKVNVLPVNTINTAVNMLSGINYMNLGLVLSKTNFGQPINEYNLLPDNIARDRLIQALNWTAYNSMNLVGGRRDMREIKIIIQLIKAGQLKPIHGSKRGRKPKSLDGSNFDNRQKMPMEDILTYCHSGQLDSGEFFCPVCFSIYFERSPGMPGDDLHWIGCDGCERWFHFVCAGVWAEGQVDANSPSWFCLACTRQRQYRVAK
ncbi:hypothetical protein BgAZ_101880 [Babesia gibsoni]|uniref:Uncharacterized protein n=1 Tax=Babesia gibsoni TaxID=33632 RepID=A0AAD8UTL1_BABGI|nr:hypothetical protein BgAZ_101880 [Babesia gibsoni]